MPQAATIGFLVNQTNSTAALYSIADMEAAARALGLKLLVLNASTEGELAPAFPNLVQLGAGALLHRPGLSVVNSKDEPRHISDIHLQPRRSPAPTNDLRAFRDAAPLQFRRLL